MTDYLITQSEKYTSALAEDFSAWEKRLRGWQVWDYAVNLEPPFSSIAVKPAPILPIQDDARMQSGFQRLFGRNQTPNTPLIGNIQTNSETTATNEASIKPPAFYRSEEISELQILLPQDLEISPTLTAQFWLSLTSCRTPIGFEFIADADRIIVQIACDASYALHLKNQLRTFFPNVYLNEQKGFLTSYFDTRQSLAIADFGLSKNFLMPLQMFRSFVPDPLTGLISFLGNLQRNEKALFQILFQPTRLAWTEELQKLQANPHFRKSLQENPPAVLSSLKEKLSAPLFAVVIRLVAQSASRQHSFEILKRIGGSFTQFANPNSNELFALNNDNYSENNHLLSILSRTSYRSGMILNAAELTALAHLPSASVKVEKLKRDERKTKDVPSLALGHSIILGENLHNGQSRQVSLSNDHRKKHIHVIGASGSGKSSLLLNSIKQDLENNQGLCVIDPHGDLIDEVIANMPDTRINDVILFDPSDSEFPIGFNILQANSELEKTLLSSDLVATFRRMSTSWGDVMDSVLANAILAFVESERGGTLFDLKRFLVEKDFRNEFLKTVKDEAIRYFWINEFPLITGKPQSSILIRLDTFLRQKLIRNIVCQKENKIDFRKIMDNRKVLLIKLSQGLIGEENAYLLGTLLVSKLYQTTLSRQDTQNRPFFSCYLDEFHHFITPSMESVLSGVRKYNLGLVLAHQEFRQLQSRSLEVASSVLSNCYTRICFRLGDTDAEKFASGFSFFDAKALQNLGIGEAIARIERSEYDFNLKTVLLPKVERNLAEQRRVGIIHSSREKFSIARNEVESNLFAGQAKPTDFGEIPKSEELPKPKEPQTKVKAEKQSLEPTSEANNQHLYLQGIIKRIGESNGFVATLEKQVFGGIGKVDVALENDHYKIACEIAVTNKVEYELQNIQKCLASGFDKVVVISSDTKHLGNIRKKAESLISADQLAKVNFLEPENFHLFLESLQGHSYTATIEETKIKGYKVNADFKVVSDLETATRKQTVFDIIKGVIKRKGKK